MSMTDSIPADLETALATIDPARMFEYTRLLSEPDFAGRRVGTEEHDRASVFLLDQWHQLGWETETREFLLLGPMVNLLAPPRLEQLASDGSVARTFTHRVEFYEHPRSAAALTAREGPVVALADEATKEGAWVKLEEVPPRTEFAKFARQLAQQGAIGILVPSNDTRCGYLIKQLPPAIPIILPVLSVRVDLLPALVGERVRARVPVDFPSFNGLNVLAHRQGTAEQYASAPLLVGAHYDGMGDDPGGLRYPGATDNAAAVAVLLELARILALAPTLPRRPLTLIAFDAEEVGAQGSHALALQFKEEGKVPLVLNLDGAACRQEAVWVETGAHSEQLRQAIDQAGRWLDIPLVSEKIPSDQRAFAYEGFPAAGLCVGAAWLHTPADSIDQVQPEALEMAAQLLLTTTWQLAWEA